MQQQSYEIPQETQHPPPLCVCLQATRPAPPWFAQQQPFQ
jgi:hypothetical protein